MKNVKIQSSIQKTLKIFTRNLLRFSSKVAVDSFQKRNLRRLFFINSCKFAKFSSKFSYTKFSEVFSEDLLQFRSFSSEILEYPLWKIFKKILLNVLKFRSSVKKCQRRFIRSFERLFLREWKTFWKLTLRRFRHLYINSGRL